MNSVAISAGAFALVFSGAPLGAFLGSRLPKHHLSGENKEVVRLAMALVGTIAGMALGLLIGSAKSYYDTQSNELTQMSANVARLGELLEQYGLPRLQTQSLTRQPTRRTHTERRHYTDRQLALKMTSVMIRRYDEENH
jgi:hypothetical protein